MQPSVSILGAGWIGLPLAHTLKQRGHVVRVTTTSEEKAHRLQAEGLEVFRLALTPTLTGEGWEEFLDSDLLIVSIPPKVAKMGADYHPEQMRQLVKHLPEQVKVLYTGSTGVFADHSGETVNEDTLPRLLQPRAQALGHAEGVLREHLNSRLTILRFGGLMGYDRIPGKMVRTKPLRQPQDRVNFVHRDDAIELIIRTIGGKHWGEVLHAVAPVAATRQAVYAAVAIQGGWALPNFEESTAATGHVVLGEKTQRQLQFTYKYPDPSRFSYDFS
ncbi:MAG TPA: hypothetical protein DCE41_03785 [Cytophagales bacterium]|nr:hypothetical protein [Cytophagales bacterium]